MDEYNLDRAEARERTAQHKLALFQQALSNALGEQEAALLASLLDDLIIARIEQGKEEMADRIEQTSGIRP